MSDHDLELATQAAHSAGEILLDFWARRDELAVSNKRAGDFVSEADVTTEKHLQDVLLADSPGDSWLGEESGAAAGGGRRWIVDPLDGTTNFLRGIPHWSVSIALEVAGKLTVGVVYDPVKSETFAAQLGLGATVNGKPIKVAATTELSSALLGTGIPFGSMPHIDDSAADISRLMPRCAGVRRMGSAALDLAYVASGRLDAFWERRLKLWDIAAGLVLLREVGAVVEGWTQDEPPELAGNVVTASPGIFSEFAAELRAG